MDVRLESLFPTPVLHPEVVLKHEFLDRYGIGQAELARAIGVEASRTHQSPRWHALVSRPTASAPAVDLVSESVLGGLHN